MRIKFLLPLAFVFALAAAPSPAQTAPQDNQPKASSALERPGERHLRNVRQLTFGGENAEAYWSGDGRSLIFQSKRDGRACDQIYTMRVGEGAGAPRMVSTGGGATTCSYFFPDGKRILYASTHEASKECPPRPDYSKGYIWPIHTTFDIYAARPDGTEVKRLTSTHGYDAEATVSADGRRIVFTSMRDGDLDIYTMDADGRNVRRLTDELGYDGGAFFSRDGKRIVYRSYHPKTPEQVERYRARLRENVIEPNVFEIWVMDADGRNKRQVTRLGAASFAPYFLPDGKRIIFSSNVNDPKGRNFDLYVVGADGAGMERVTFDESFDGFPMFSPDGRRLVFASNRNARQRGDTNVFVADWVE
jgi:TolB protein